MIPTYMPQELDYFELSARDNVAEYDALEYLGVVKASLEAEKLNEYSLPELQKVENKLRQVYSSLSNEEMGKHEETVHNIFYDLVRMQDAKEQELDALIQETVSSLNELIDIYDADAPEYKARKEMGAIQKDLAAGKCNGSSLVQLEEIEAKFKGAYAALSEEDKDRYLDSGAQTIMDLTDLQNDTVEKKIEDLLDDYVSETKKDPQSWIKTAPGKYKRTPKVEFKERSKEEKDTVEYSILNLPIAPPEEVRKISAENKSYKAACVTSLPTRSAAPTMIEDKVIINCPVVPQNKPVNPLPGSDSDIVAMYEAAKKNLEAVVVPFSTSPTKRKSKLGYLASAAVVAATGILSVLGAAGYYFTSSTDTAAENQFKHYHGSPSAEVIVPVSKARHESKVPPAPQKVEHQTKSVEQPTVVPQAAPRMPSKVVKRYPASWNPYDNLHSVEKGDTLGGLYEDYAARGGTLSRAEYFKIILSTNSHLENKNSIYVGQEIILP
ncbi:MAG: hypothetical protein AABX31_04750 [Nanoarchaeota archaeon]